MVATHSYPNDRMPPGAKLEFPQQVSLTGPTESQVDAGKPYHRLTWYDTAGKRRQSWAGRSARQAIKQAEEKSRSLTAGVNPVHAKGMTLGNVVDRWISDCGHNWSETYNYAAKQILHRWLYPIWDVKLIDLNRTQIQECLDLMKEPGVSIHTGKKRGPSTREQQIQVVRHLNPCLKHAYSERLIPHYADNYTKGLRFMKTVKPQSVSSNRLTVELNEIPSSMWVMLMYEEFLKEARECLLDDKRRKNWRNRDNFANFAQSTAFAISLMAYAGLRVGEMRALTFGDFRHYAPKHGREINTTNGEIYIHRNLTESPKGTSLHLPKNGKTRVAEFPAWSVPIINPGFNDDEINGTKLRPGMSTRELFAAHGFDRPLWQITPDELDLSELNFKRYGLIPIDYTLQTMLSDVQEKYPDSWQECTVWQPSGNVECTHLPTGASSPPPNGNWIDPKYFSRVWWNKIRERLPQPESKFQVRSLRHHFASVAISRGKPITWVSQRMGHGNTNITGQVYAHLVNTQDRQPWDFEL